MWVRYTWFKESQIIRFKIISLYLFEGSKKRKIEGIFQRMMMWKNVKKSKQQEEIELISWATKLHSMTVKVFIQ